MKIFLLNCFLLFGYSAVFAQLNTSFSVNYNEVCVPEVIQFNDLSTSATATISQWEWSINGVVFSTLQNPAYLVNNPGNYTICLKTWDNLNNQDSLCISNFVVGYQSPVANFTQDNTGGCSPQNINFTDLSTLGDAPIDQWRWDFGDGNLDSTNQNPSHSYTTPGIFDLTLVVTDTNNCSASLLLSNLINITPQVTASISPNFSYLQCALPAQVNFSGNSNTPGASYTWNFNDGSTATGSTVNKTFSNAGCYSPTLTVSNGFCSATATVSSCITVSNPPVANFSVSDSTNCSIPFSPTINNSSSGMTSLTWSFGDGNVSNLYNPTHIYNTYMTADSHIYDNGVFPMVLQVSNNEGCTAADTQMIYISNLNSSILSPANICAPDTFALTAASFNISPSFYTVSYNWSADGYISDNGSQASVFYPDSGLYNASVIITDNIGCVDTAFRSLLIGIPPTIDSIQTDTNFVCKLKGISFSAFGSSYVEQWIWFFDDSSGFSGQSGTHIFQDTGFISGFLVANFRGCNTTFPLDSYYIYPPIANFEPKIICDSLKVVIEDLSIGAHHWYWDFGDSTVNTDTSTLQYPSYVYPSLGQYTITLIVFNDSTGCSDTLRQDILFQAPVSNFEITDSACAPVTLYTQNLSIDGSAWLWNAPMADSVNAADFDTKLHYKNPGIYTLSLYTSDVNGCADTFQRTLYIAGVNEHIVYQPLPACRPANVTFTDSSTGFLSPIISWTWGNGSIQNTTNETYFFPGKYPMPLTVTNDWGCSFDLVKDIDVGGLFVNFSAPQNVCIGNTMTAVGILSAPANANAYEPFTLIWDFGDGQRDTTTSQTISHYYAAAGVYDICLEVIDSLGCSSIFCRPDWVEVHDPSVAFTADTFYSSCPPLQVNFNNLAASGTQWLWSFGDGSVSSLQNPSHVYSTPGFYDVSLQITAFPGCSDIDTIVQMIQIDGPSGFFYMPPQIQCAPYTTQLVGFGNNVASYTWLFDNGDFVINNSTASSDTAVYTYSSAGTYSPTLVINDGAGCEIAFQRDSIVVLPTPTADFVADSLACLMDSIHYQIVSAAPGLSINWLFEQGQPATSTVDNPTVLYTDTGNYDVQLIVNENGCADTLVHSEYVQILPGPVAQFGVDSAFCIPFSVVFSDSSFSPAGNINSWQWDFGNGQKDSIPNSTSMFTYADTFNIQLIVSDNNGCIDSAEQQIIGFEPPIASILADSVVCLSDTIQLLASGGINYLWINSPAVSDSSIANPTSHLDSFTFFTVVVTNSNQCKDTAQIGIDVWLPQTDSLINQTICRGDSINLPYVNGQNIEWSGANLTCNNCQNPVVYPYDSSRYYVVYNDGNNCPVLDSSHVFVIDLTQLQALTSDSICPGDSIQLSVQGYQGLPLTWSPDYALSSTTSNNLWAAPATSTSYVVQVASGNCLRADTVHVFVQNLPDISATGNQFCQGDSATIHAFGSSIGYLWTPTDFLSNDSIAMPISSAENSMQYTVVGGNACGLDSATVSVWILPPPSIQIDSIISSQIGVDIVLANNLPLSYNYQWSPAADLSCNNCPDPVWQVDGNQTFYVTATDTEGCSSMDSVVVISTLICTDESVYVPNAFSPNQDGHNDVLQLQSSSITSIDIFQVYNRWGQLVFETKDMSNGWDGKFKGTTVAPDVYGYFLLFNCPGNDQKILKKGNVTILR